MSGPRVYGTVVHHGLRHEASGVIDGTFAKTKGGWDTNTTCGTYCNNEVETDDGLAVNCIRCLGKKRGTGGYEGILRGKTADYVVIDEVQHMTNPCAEIPLPTFFDVSRVEVPATHAVAGTPSVLRRPSRAERRASRRLRSRG